MRRARLETFRQSRVVVVDVVVVVVFVRAYSPVTGNRARQLRRSTPRDDVGPMNPVVAHSGPLLAVAGTGAGEGLAISGDALPPLDGDVPPDKGSLTAPGKGSAGDAAPGEGAAEVCKSLLVRSRIWSTNSCICELADTPLAFSWLAGAFAVKSRTPV